MVKSILKKLNEAQNAEETKAAEKTEKKSVGFNDTKTKTRIIHYPTAEGDTINRDDPLKQKRGKIHAQQRDSYQKYLENEKNPGLLGNKDDINVPDTNSKEVITTRRQKDMSVYFAHGEPKNIAPTPERTLRKVTRYQNLKDFLNPEQTEKNSKDEAKKSPETPRKTR